MSCRLDMLMALKGLTTSREKAKEYIRCQMVKVNGVTVTKPSFTVDDDCVIEITGDINPYVSRGGLKLEKALKVFGIDLAGKVCLDIGASTGGFTDCMLKHGAKKVFAVDVGHGQLDASLVQNPAVVNLEGVNVKDFSMDIIGTQVDFAAADLSFISVNKSLKALKSVLKDGLTGVILIKPQFEVGKANIGKGGIVKKPQVHINMLNDLIPYIESCGFEFKGISTSPIKGGDGNIEYIAAIRNSSDAGSGFLLNFDVKGFVNDSFDSFKSVK